MKGFLLTRNAKGKSSVRQYQRRRLPSSRKGGRTTGFGWKWHRFWRGPFLCTSRMKKLLARCLLGRAGKSYFFVLLTWSPLLQPAFDRRAKTAWNFPSLAHESCTTTRPSPSPNLFAPVPRWRSVTHFPPLRGARSACCTPTYTERSIIRGYVNTFREPWHAFCSLSFDRVFPGMAMRPYSWVRGLLTLLFDPTAFPAFRTASTDLGSSCVLDQGKLWVDGSRVVFDWPRRCCCRLKNCSFWRATLRHHRCAISPQKFVPFTDQRHRLTCVQGSFKSRAHGR